MKGLSCAQLAVRHSRCTNPDAYSIAVRSISTLSTTAPRQVAPQQLPGALGHAQPRVQVIQPIRGTFRKEPKCQRYFSQTSAASSKNKGKVHRANAEEDHEPEDDEGDDEGDHKNTGPKADPDDRFNFADVEAAYKRADEHFGTLLKMLRQGGQFNPTLLGKLRIRPDKSSPDTYPLQELARISHKGGRNVSIIAHDADYVKPIMSAVQISPEFNQQPQRNPENDMELIIKIEPVSPIDQARRVKEVCNQWRDRLRGVYRRRSKIHSRWFKDDKIINKDERLELDLKVKQLQDKRMAAVKTREKQDLEKLAQKMTLG